MDFNIEVRKKQLESLDQFISSSRDKVQSVLDALGWTASGVLKNNGLIKCSVDSSHRVPKGSVDDHVKRCSIKFEGYDLDEKFLSEPQNDPKYSIAIDDHKKIEIFAEAKRNSNSGFRRGWNGQDPDPKTSDRLTSTYTSDERRSLYDYAVKNTCARTPVPEFNITIPRENTTKTLTYEEELALERDAKRRRAKHKSVHTSKKNYTEVMREVIDCQMDMYKEWLEADTLHPKKPDNEKLPDLNDIKNDKQKDDRSESGYAHSTTSRNSTYSGRSRSRSRKRDYEYSRGDRDKRRERDRTHDYKRDKYEHHKYDDHHYRSHHRNRSRDRSDRGNDKYRENHRLSRHRHS